MSDKRRALPDQHIAEELADAGFVATIRDVKGNLTGCDVPRPQAPVPCALAGLLRPGTGVTHADYGALVVVGPSNDGTGWYDCAAADSGYSLHPDTLTLDLSSPTTRAHLAWWIYEQPAGSSKQPMSLKLLDAIVLVSDTARRGRPMSPNQIAILIAVARHFAGLEP